MTKGTSSVKLLVHPVKGLPALGQGLGFKVSESRVLGVGYEGSRTKGLF